MYKLILIFICFSLQSVDLFGQQDLNFKSIISIKPIRLLVDEIPISFEYRYGQRKSVEFDLGAVYSNPIINKFVEGTVFFYFKGFSTGIKHKWYPNFNNQKTSYLAAGLHYKYKYFLNKSFALGIGDLLDTRTFRLHRGLGYLDCSISGGRIFQHNNWIQDLSLKIGVAFVKAKTVYLDCSYCGKTIYEGEIHEEDQFRFQNGLYVIPSFSIIYKFGVKLN